jgi:hypothetical protein
MLAVAIAGLRGEPVGWLFHGAIFGDTPFGYGHNLPFVYLMSITALALLCLPCRWFAHLKQTRHDGWLSYLSRRESRKSPSRLKALSAPSAVKSF